MREQRGELRVLVAVAVDVPRPVVGRRPRETPEATPAKDAPDAPSGDTSRIARRSGSFGSKNGSGWIDADVRHACATAGASGRACSTTIEMTSTTSAGAEPRRAEHREDLEALEGVDDRRSRTAGRSARG